MFSAIRYKLPALFCLVILSFPGLLGAQDAAPQDSLQQAVANLSDSNPQIRRKAADTLGQMRNPTAADALIKALQDPVP